MARSVALVMKIEKEEGSFEQAEDQGHVNLALRIKPKEVAPFLILISVEKLEN